MSELTDFERDAALVAAANEGDSAAFEALYYRYRDWVVGLAYRVTGDREAALDVLQDTFVYFLKKFPGFRLTASMRTFLYPVVRHLAVERMRKGRRMRAVGADLTEVEAEPATGGGTRAELSAVMADLPEAQREVVLLRFVDAMSLQEIAGALGIPVGTVKSRLHHALERLRDDERTKKYFER